MKKKSARFEIILLAVLFSCMLSVNLVTAGVGIKWDKESLLVNEGDKSCMTYSVYNPWPEDSYAMIELSKELQGVLTLQEAETKFIPANTKSTDAIPVKFCFEIPQVYQEDCLVSNYVCKQDCTEEQKVYLGEVVVKSTAPPKEIGDTGGSTTSMSVSAPLTLKIRCNAHARDFTLVYSVLAVIALIVILALIYRKYRKPKLARDKEKLKKLQEQIRRERKQKK
jgi:hypothetical protein